jgi:hypothetical protein
MLVCGCKNSTTNKDRETKNVQPWIFVSLRTDGEIFSITNDEDSLEIIKILNSKKRKDSIFVFKISNKEKDSLFKWSEALLYQKITPKNFCTDYYGRLNITIMYSRQVTTRIEYTSICEWQNLDSNALKIYQLIAKRHVPE